MSNVRFPNKAKQYAEELLKNLASNTMPDNTVIDEAITFYKAQEGQAEGVAMLLVNVAFCRCELMIKKPTFNCEEAQAYLNAYKIAYQHTKEFQKSNDKQDLKELHEQLNAMQKKFYTYRHRNLASYNAKYRYWNAEWEKLDIIPVRYFQRVVSKQDIFKGLLDRYVGNTSPTLSAGLVRFFEGNWDRRYVNEIQSLFDAGLRNWTNYISDFVSRVVEKIGSNIKLNDDFAALMEVYEDKTGHTLIEAIISAEKRTNEKNTAKDERINAGARKFS